MIYFVGKTLFGRYHQRYWNPRLCRLVKQTLRPGFENSPRAGSGAVLQTLTYEYSRGTRSVTFGRRKSQCRSVPPIYNLPSSSHRQTTPIRPTFYDCRSLKRETIWRAWATAKLFLKLRVWIYNITVNTEIYVSSGTGNIKHTLRNLFIILDT